MLCFVLGATLLAPRADGREPDPKNYETYSGFSVPETPVLPTHEVHPSLWFGAGDVPRLQAQITSDSFSAERWKAIERRASLSSPDPVAPAAPIPLTRLDESIHRYYGAISISARAHALIAVLSPDPAARAAHLARAKALLLRAYDGPIFELDSRVASSPVDEIYRGTWLQNYAHAYDLIQPSLTSEEDRLVRDRLAREAQCVYENLYIWSPRSPHNHLSKPAWGLGSMALAMSSDPRAKGWLHRTLEATNRNTRYFFAADGLYREGSHYDIFSLINYLPFLYQYRNVAGVDDFPIFQPAFEYFVEARNSRGWLPNIEDSYLCPTPTQLAARAYTHSKTRLSATAPLSEVLAWSYATADLTPFADSKGGFTYTGASGDYPLEIDELLTRDPSIKTTAPDCAPAQFLPSGQSVMRTAWTETGATARALLFQGVAEADNHNHPDHLSFILEAEGQQMASDSGYAAENYHDGSRLKWFATAPAHNTLTFDGKPAVDEASNHGPKSLFTFAGPNLQVEQKATQFSERALWQRTIAMVADDHFLVIDTVQAGEQGKIASYLHGGRGQLALAGNLATWTYQNDRYGHAAQLQATFCAPGATATSPTGEITYLRGDHASFGYLKLEALARKAAWITLLAPRPAGAPAAFITADLSDSHRDALQFSDHKSRSLVIAQAEGGTRVQAEDLESDAKVAFVRESAAGEMTSFFAIEGTFLRWRGKLLWSSPSPSSGAH